MEKALGERIRAARKAYGMTQTTLAARIRLSKTALNQIEQGRTHDPGVSRVREIARVLHVSSDYLLGLTETPQPRGAHTGEAP